MSGTAWGLAAIWNASLNTDRQRPLEARDHVWASELGKSYYDRFHKMKGRKATTPPNMRARRKFEAGSLMEWVVSQVLVRAGVLHTTQDYITNEEGAVKVTGKADFVAGGMIQDVDLDDMPETFALVAQEAIEVLKKRFPNGLRDQGLEIKSCSAFMFERYLKQPSRHHALQAFHYAYNTKKPYIIVYISRDDLRVCEWVIEPDDAGMKQRYFEDLDGMAKVIAAGAPEKEPMLLWDADEQKFTKNWEVEYSLYLTDYGFERPDEFTELLKPHCTHLNSVIKRWNDGAKMTANNIQWYEDGIAFDPKVAEVFNKLGINPLKAKE